MKTTLKYITLFLIFSLSGCQAISNKFAFYPDTINNIPTESLPKNIQERYITTADGVKIQSYFIPNESSKNIVIYFHGNAGNISHRIPDLIQIGKLGVNVLGVEYRGYGKSGGTPSENGIYIDGNSALIFVINELGFNVENIYIFGRSIGTTVAINTSINKKIAGVILVSPLTSGNDQAKSMGLGPISFLAGNSFNNIGKVGSIISPVLVIHGKKDQVIPYDMGVKIYEKIKSDKQLITIAGAGHNDIASRFKAEYWEPISKFINIE